ncbi:MAG TPA: ATP-binding cassette domain-containing protein [Vitreimonas sp.]|uniref:ATP-binding cassette domain-containing protein n=1 Tax=Vitreimonas sp. TaxID=3069702 RepID=UPI002D23A02C|nr:ATP-binding cassette domain-containing protein [Vitreimonas sp.]HYD89410.1 ATP-binding cassette domain-containing protein [Vitreimonas sp.]
MARLNPTDLELFERGVLVRLANVDAGYGAATVLLGVDFEARAGEVALVTGPAAAGKTTLTHLLRLALPSRSGRALIMGVDVARANGRQLAEVKRKIGYVAETPTFIEHWSAFDNIAMPLRMLGKKPRDYAEDVRELVDFVGIGEAADLAMEKLSGAERRRAAIARALAAKPHLILADDPTAGMSPADGRRVVKLLAEMRRVGAGVVIASQDESLAECAPMDVWRIDRGRVAKAAAPLEAEAQE